VTPFGGLLAHLATARDARTARCSSWDHSGRTQDAWMIAPGQAITLADLEGPGCITHLWMTQSCRRFYADRLVSDPDYYRKVLLRMTWDDQAHPSVLVPLGDFFCLGHSIANDFASLPCTASVNPDQRYRFHLVDPVRFSRSIRVTMEHGHGNHSANDWASTAYWYQDRPSRPIEIAPVSQRLPLRAGDLGVVPILPPVPVPPIPGGLSDEMRTMSDEHRRAVEQQQAEWTADAAARWEVTKEQSRHNVEAARRLRRAWAGT
jgi:hypothetical protein